MASLRTTARKAFTGVMAAILGVTWSFQAVAAQSVGTEATRAVEYAAQLERSLMAIEDGRRQLPRDRFDPQYVVDQVGIDPAALHAYVRDEIGWIPYRGRLRGPTGVLMDRQGNALDTALLLADLMTRAGHEARLARATLAPDAVDSLWAYFAELSAAATAEAALLAAAPAETADPEAAPVEAVAAPDAPAAEPALAEEPVADDSGSMFGDFGSESGSLFEAVPAEEVVVASGDEAAQLYELDAEAAGQKLQEAAATRAATAADLDRRVLGQGARLLAMFSASEDGAQQAYEQARARQALADHWWVQVADGAGGWTDYDPLGPGGEPGRSWTAAEQTLSPSQLPPELQHRVQLRVVAEQLVGGKLREDVVLEHELAASEVIGQRISLRHLPLLWPSEWAAVTPDDVQEKLFAALLTQNEWMPALTVGEEAFQQSSIKDSGAVNPDPQPQTNPFLQITFPAAGKVGRVADLFDVLLDESAALNGEPVEQAPGEALRAEGELTAEWLEYTILVPGEEPKVVRRQVFDILGPALRRGGDFSEFRLDEDKRLARSGGQMTETELVILPAWPAGDFLADLTAGMALANKPLLTEFTRDPFGKAPPNSIELFSKMSGMPGAAYLYATLRAEAAATAGLVFVDRPQIVAQHGVLTRVGPGEMTAKAALDVIENGVGVDPFAADAFTVRVLQGIADTNAEFLALGEGGTNVGEAFEKAVEEPEWTVFFPDDRDMIATLGLAPDMLARLLADLDAGHAIVSPTGDAKPFELAGWWRVDPATGTTLGMGNQGWGSVLVEYAFYLTIQVMLAQISCMAFTAAAEEKISSLSAEQGREKVKTWARNCVSQALLETIAGLSTSWISSRFLEGAKVPTWNDRAKGGTRTGGRHGPTPHIDPAQPHDGSTPKRNTPPTPPEEANAKPPRRPNDPIDTHPPHPDERRKQPPCRADAGFVRFAALSPELAPVRSDALSPEEEMLLAAGAGCGNNRTERMEDAPKRPPHPDDFPEQAQKVKKYTDDYVAAKQREVEAAERYYKDRTPANRQAYKEAYEHAQNMHMREVNKYAEAGGKGLPPGSYQAPKVPPPPPGWEPLPPPPGEKGAPPPSHKPPPVRDPALDDTAAAPPPAKPADAQPAPNKTQPMDNAPPLPPRNTQERVDAIRKQTDDRIRAEQRETAAERALDADPTNPARRLELERALEARNKAHMAEIEAWNRAGGKGFPPTKEAVLSPGRQTQMLTAGETGAQAAPAPGGAPPAASAQANSIPDLPAKPMQQAGGRTIDPIQGVDPAPNPVAPIDGQFQPNPPPPQRLPPSDAQLSQAIKPFTDAHVSAHQNLIDVINRANANPTPENLRAHEQAVLAQERAKILELREWVKAGGDASVPPVSRQGGLPPLPELNVPPVAATGGAAPNQTLAMGLGALAGAVQKGP